MNISLCVGQNCGDQTSGTGLRRTAAPGLRLCTACHHELKASLIELPKIYDDCEPALHFQHSPTVQRVSGSHQTTGILLDEESIATRSGILSFLASWSALVADERAVARPTRRQPTDLASFLIVHLDWVLAHAAAADFAAEVARITRHACRSTYTRPSLRVDLGLCVYDDCNAALTMAPPTREGRQTFEVRCTAGHSWQPRQWLQLSRQIQQTDRGPDTTGPHQSTDVA
jgi:hypothetical protein